MRQTSYRLLKKQIDKGNVKLIEEEVAEEYYPTGEKCHEVVFSIDYEKLTGNDWKTEFLVGLSMMSIENRSNLMEQAFLLLRGPIEQGINFDKKENQNFILTALKEFILDYYQMFDSKIPVRIEYQWSIRSYQKIFDKTIKTLEQKGYTKEGESENYWYNFGGEIHVCQTFNVVNTSYPDSLSGFRWLQRKERMRGEKLGNVRDISYFDKFGCARDLFPVPYLSQKRYFYYLKKNLFLAELLKKLDFLNEGEKSNMEQLVRGTYFLLSSDNAVKCIRNIVERYSPEIYNYFHDWNLIICDLISTRCILTEGAIVSILTGSYNYAQKTVVQLRGINQNILKNKKVMKCTSVREIRKNMSRILRNRKDCTSYVNTLNSLVMEYQQKCMKIPAKYTPLLMDYIGRMKKYCNTITLYSLNDLFGNKLLKFIKKEAACIFRPEVLLPSYAPVVQEVKRFLKSRSKVAKRVYKKFQNELLLQPIQEECLLQEQALRVMEILKEHNVKLMNKEYENLEYFQCVIEQKGSPEFLTAGNATVCCMSYGSQKAVTYAKEEGFGIVNVYYKDRVIANSLIWINEPYQCLVLDNIEVHPNYCRFSSQLKNCFYTVTQHLLKEYGLYFAVQGADYNDLELYDAQSKEIFFDKMEPKKVNSWQFYTDASISRLITSNMTEEEIEVILEHGAEEFSSASFLTFCKITEWHFMYFINQKGELDWILWYTSKKDTEGEYGLHGNGDTVFGIL